MQSFGSLSVRQPENMSLGLQDIVEIKQGSPDALMLPVSPRGSSSRRGKHSFGAQQTPPPYLFTLKTRTDRYMILQAPNQRKLDIWVDTLRRFVFEFGSPVLTRRDVAWAARSSPEGTSDIVLLGRGRMMERKHRKRFFQMIQGNDINAISRLLNANGNLINVTDSKSNTPLMIAARSGNASVIRTLLKYGADLNCANGEGFTPVELATRHGHFRCVETLLQVRQIVASANGLDIELLNSQGKSLLHVAVTYNKPTIVSMLCEYASDLVDWPDKHGNTPLHTAGKYGKINCMKILLETAADPNILNRRGKTPYALARERSYRDCARLLKQYGGSRKGHMPEEHGRKREIDMDRVMLIWSAFLENSFKSFTNPSFSAGTEHQNQKPEFEVVNGSGSRFDKSQQSNTTFADGSGSYGYDSVESTKKSVSTPYATISAGAGGGAGKYASGLKGKDEGAWVYGSDEKSGRGYWYNESTHESAWEDGEIPVEEFSNEYAAFPSAQTALVELASTDEVWTYHMDEHTGAPYWFNNVTQESQWVDAPAPASGHAAEETHAGSTSEVVWEYVYDEASGSNYWHNSATGESTWEGTAADDGEVPIASSLGNNGVEATWEYHIDEEYGEGYWYNVATGESKWVAVDQDAASTESFPTPQRAVVAESTTTTALLHTARGDANGVWEYLTDPISGRPYWWNGATGESSWAD
eukprot:g4111.t1